MDVSAQDFWTDFNRCNDHFANTEHSVVLNMTATQENRIIDEQEFTINNTEKGKHLKAFHQDYVLENREAIIVDRNAKTITELNSETVDKMISSMLMGNQMMESMKEEIYVKSIQENDLTIYSLYMKEDDRLFSKITLNSSNSRFLKSITYPTVNQVANRFEGVVVMIDYRYYNKVNALAISDVFSGGTMGNQLENEYASYTFIKSVNN